MAIVVGFTTNRTMFTSRYRGFYDSTSNIMRTFDAPQAVFTVLCLLNLLLPSWRGCRLLVVVSLALLACCSTARPRVAGGDVEGGEDGELNVKLDGW